ncbi:hypothetical protein [Maridesulfovibrio salexigens]|uniref:Uncharacterized protein n=1 Tax=Maridesulfovibrio salexigens (strain ATCC 14822 / DSM 2638 / NCIMB 8403 / VKM B-1763) TaxID=526222 RepID=C6BXZ5_MARSD|nr:hypothetical protein [Maridesulfovibrio salexigens]ACS80525.1 hypothetical protein Desal_2469 [Maridesulfovibrio salexigens DSM 2638]
MTKIEEIQKRITTTPSREDVKTCLREAISLARGQDALLSIHYLALSIFGLLKIKDLTKPEKNAFYDNIGKILGRIDLMPVVKEATRDEDSLLTTFESKGLKNIFTRLQKLNKDIKKVEKEADQRKILEDEKKLKVELTAISRELEKGHVAAAKSKADRLIDSHPKNKFEFLDRIIPIFEEKESIKGWWHYLQLRYDPNECNLDEAKHCASKVAKIKTLDDPKNAQDWFRNNLDYRLRVWELTPKEDHAEIDAIVEACYNLAICVYYCRDEINGMRPRNFGRALIEEGLKYAPDSPHLRKMAKTFGVRI